MDRLTDQDHGPSFAPSCTVVIPTRERPAELDRCLDALQRQNYGRFQVVVVDSAPRNSQARDVAARWGARYEIEPLPGASRARNRGARSAGSEIIAYLDDDAVPESNWLANLVVEFRDPRVMAATGRIRPLHLVTEAERLFDRKGGYDRGTRRQSVDRETPRWFERATFGDLGSEANMAFRRSAFDVWAGFEERLGRGAALGGGEGDYAFFRLVERGYRIVYTPAAVVHHPYPPTMEDLRSLHVRLFTSSAAYVTFLFFEHRQHRRAILRFVYGRLRGVPRVWHDPASPPAPRIIPRWRVLLGCLRGPLLYARSLPAQWRSLRTP